MRRSPCSSPTRRDATWPSNLAACLMLGYTRDELLGLRLTDVARYEAAAGEFEELMDTGTKLGVSELTRKDGTTRSLQLRRRRDRRRRHERLRRRRRRGRLAG